MTSEAKTFRFTRSEFHREPQPPKRFPDPLAFKRKPFQSKFYSVWGKRLLAPGIEPRRPHRKRVPGGIPSPGVASRRDRR